MVKRCRLKKKKYKPPCGSFRRFNHNSGCCVRRHGKCKGSRLTAKRDSTAGRIYRQRGYHWRKGYSFMRKGKKVMVPRCWVKNPKKKRRG